MSSDPVIRTSRSLSKTTQCTEPICAANGFGWYTNSFAFCLAESHILTILSPPTLKNCSYTIIGVQQKVQTVFGLYVSASVDWSPECREVIGRREFHLHKITSRKFVVPISSCVSGSQSSFYGIYKVKYQFNYLKQSDLRFFVW